MPLSLKSASSKFCEFGPLKSIGPVKHQFLICKKFAVKLVFSSPLPHGFRNYITVTRPIKYLLIAFLKYVKYYSYARYILADGGCIPLPKFATDLTRQEFSFSFYLQK